MCVFWQWAVYSAEFLLDFKLESQDRSKRARLER